MAPRTRPEDVLRQGFRALLRALPGAQAGDTKAVHKARVACRRVREALPVLAAAAPRRRKLQRRVERIRRTLGPVRELDVSLALTEELAREAPELSVGLGLVRNSLHAERRIRGERLIGRLEHLDRRRLRARAERLLDEAASEPSAEVAAAAALLARLTRRVDELHDAVKKAGPLYAPDPIHDVRLAAKKVRYTLELARDLRWLRTRSALGRLTAVQDTLGRLNDLQVLAHRADALRAESAPHDDGRVALEALAAALEVQCRTLHARYLAGRLALLEAVDRALAEVGGRASAPQGVTAERVGVR